jgi:MFS family permease
VSLVIPGCQRGDELAASWASATAASLASALPSEPSTLRIPSMGRRGLWRVNGNQYLHLVVAIQGERYQIGNIRGASMAGSDAARSTAGWCASSRSATGFAAGAALLGVGTAMVYPTLLAAIGDVAHPPWRASSVGVYRLWRDLGYAVGALLAGLTADALGLPAAMWLVAGLTFASGIVVAVRMTETHRRPTAPPRSQSTSIDAADLGRIAAPGA